MPKGKDTAEQVPPEVVEPVEGEEPTTPPETPTAPELPAEIKAEIEKLKGEVGRLNIGLARKEGENKRLREQQPKPVSTQPTSQAIEIMLADMKARQTEFGEGNPRITQLEVLLAEEKRKEETARQREQIEVVTSEWRGKLEDRIIAAGEDPHDDKFEDVWDTFDVTYAVDGKFERVEKKLTRVLGATKPKETGKTETEEERIERKAEEKYRARAKEAGLLTTETGEPSASGETWTEFERRYVQGNVPLAEYEARARKEGKI